MGSDRRRDFYFGKRILITGGSSGIGLALARQLAARGASLWLAARDRARLESAAGELRSAAAGPSQKVGFTPADVAVESQARNAAEQAAEGLGPLDILINSAGVSHPGYFLETDAKVFRETMEINYFGTLNTIRAVVPDMVRRGRGHIVNISSVVGFLAMFGYASYAPTKWAVRGLSDALRCELKPLGIRMTLAMPPDTKTPALEREKKIRPKELDIISASNAEYAPEAVARDILAGVERNRYIVITGPDSNFLYILTNLLGPLQYPVVDIVVADAIRKKKKAQAQGRLRV